MPCFQELPSLPNDLEEAKSNANAQLAIMGECRITPLDCRSYWGATPYDTHAALQQV